MELFREKHLALKNIWKKDGKHTVAEGLIEVDPKTGCVPNYILHM